eukprot:GHVU01040161.1.p1 GENE.GHVU01040161.1~~GHVU01040161.1.p1  ORF type:complete len:134 (+),score=10.98 GHVU01040161.1:351-752(+)
MAATVRKIVPQKKGGFPLSPAVVFGNTVYVSGQLGFDPQTGALPSGIVAQTHQTLKNMQSVLRQAGSDLNNVVKVMIIMQDLGDVLKMNAVYGQYFPTNPPARICYQVAKVPAGGLIEMDAVAVLGKIVDAKL